MLYSVIKRIVIFTFLHLLYIKFNLLVEVCNRSAAGGQKKEGGTTKGEKEEVQANGITINATTFC